MVSLLREYRANLPGISSLKRDCANVSFFPSMIDTLFLRAFPPTADDRARLRGEWELLDRVAGRVGTLCASGDAVRAEALRTAAVTFFNAWLTDDEVDLRIQAKGRAALRKR